MVINRKFALGVAAGLGAAWAAGRAARARYAISFEQRVVVSARKLEELDARGKKEVAPLEEVDARAVGPELPEKQKSERARRLTQQPLLTLAPPPDQEG